MAALGRRLGAQLLHRSTRGVTPTEVGAACYDKCKAIAAQLDEADSLALLMQARLGGTLRVGTSAAFGGLVPTPLVQQLMRLRVELQVEMGFKDCCVNLAEQGIDVAVRMGRLANSQLRSRHLGTNPWVLVAAPAYLAALVYSRVQGDGRWHFTAADGRTEAVPVRGPLTSRQACRHFPADPSAAAASLGSPVSPTHQARHRRVSPEPACQRPGE